MIPAPPAAPVRKLVIGLAGAAGGHIDHARGAVELLLQGHGHGLLHHLGTGADILGGDLDLGRHQGRGQALYSSLSFGAGGALGSLASGYLWSAIGPQAMYLMAAGAAMCALVVVLLGLRNLPES